MKKLLQTIISYRTIPVIDAENGQKQQATYLMLFGITMSISYK
ncbi:hypothetical protein [Chryseobacterium mulctrae]|nr:hypothetical protein [Chryseobacterium mulctrae]